MADAKITDLIELSVAPANDDVVAIVDSDAAPATTKKITAMNLVNNNSAVQANTSKVSADGLVTTHSDVTSAGSGQIITIGERTSISNNSSDITNIINNLLYKEFARQTTGLINQGTGFSEFLSLDANVPVNGTYKVSWYYLWSYNDIGTNFEARLQHNNTTDLMNHHQEPADVGGTGVVLPVVGGGTANTGTNQRVPSSGEDVLSLVAGSNTFDLDFSCELANSEAAIYKAVISIERVS